MQRLIVTIGQDEYETLRRLAYERRVSIAEVVREAIDAVHGTHHRDVPKPGRGPQKERA